MLAMQALKVGDVMGIDIKLPKNLKRLEGWIIFKIDEQKGSVKLLEPNETYPKTQLTYDEAESHIKELQHEGHKTARLWNEGDKDDIGKIVPEKATEIGLDVNSFWFSNSRYWGEGIIRPSWDKKKEFDLQRAHIVTLIYAAPPNVELVDTKKAVPNPDDQLYAAVVGGITVKVTPPKCTARAVQELPLRVLGL